MNVEQKQQMETASEKFRLAIMKACEDMPLKMQIGFTAGHLSCLIAECFGSKTSEEFEALFSEWGRKIDYD